MSNPVTNSQLYKDDGKLKELLKTLKEIQTVYATMSDGITNKAKALELALNGVNLKTDEGRRALKEAAAETSRLEKLTVKYNRALSNNAVDVARVNEEIKKLNRHNKLQATIVNSTATSYNRLKATYDSNIQRLKALSQGTRDNTAEGQRLIHVTQRMKNELRRLDDQFGRNRLSMIEQNTSASRLWGSLKNLVLTYLSITTVMRLANSVFRNTKSIDSLNFAYNQVIDTSAELVRSQQFIKDITTDLGLDYISTSKAYLKYRAAIKSTNLTIEESDKIFTSFAKASAVLGLSTSENKGVFLALEQMISKGKISSEELRLQLGERMPGALDIFAKSMGVSVMTLSDMLKKGEVISAETLPAFARELEKAYNITDVKTVDTLTAAQNRLNREWVLFVEFLEGSDAIKRVFDSLREGLVFIRSNFSTIVNLTKGVALVASAFVSWHAALLITNVAQRLSIGATIADIASKGLLAAATGAAARAQAAFNLVLKNNPYALVATVLATIISGLVLFEERVDKTKESLKNISVQAEQSIVAAKLKTEALVEVLKDENAEREDKVKALKELKKINKDYFGALDTEKSKITDIDDALKSYSASILVAAKAQAAINRIIQLEQELLDTDKLWEESETSLLDYATAAIKSGGNIFLLENRLQIQRAKNFQERKNQIEEEIAALGILADPKNIIPISTITDDDDDDDDDDKGKTDKQLEAAEKQITKMKDLAAEGQAILGGKAAEARLEYDKTIRKIDDMKAKLAEFNRDFKMDVKVDFSPTVQVADITLARKLDELLFAENDKIKDGFDILEEQIRKGLKFSVQSPLEEELAKSIPESFLAKNEARADELKKAVTSTFEDDVKDEGLFAAIGFKLGLDEDEIKGLQTTFSFVKKQLTSLASFRKKIADQEVTNSANEVRSKETALKNEIANRNAGYAHSVESATRDLDLAKDTQKKALKEQEKAQKQQLAAQAVQEAGNLVGAAAKIWYQLGFPFAIPAIALMFGTFAAVKLKAAQLSKKKFSTGGYEKLGGGSHASGKDTYLGFESEGKPAFAEKDEGIAIFNKKAVNKYGDIIPQLVESANNLQLHNVMDRQQVIAKRISVQVNNISDNAKMEYYLMQLLENSKNSSYNEKDGTPVITRNNVTQRVHG